MTNIADLLVYLTYPLLFVLWFAGSKWHGRKKFNDEFMSQQQTKYMHGLLAVGVYLHHTAQKSCAYWHRPEVIVHGLDIFVDMGYLFVAAFFFFSGFGLYKSYVTKPDYLKGFIRKRILPVMLTAAVIAWIFIPVRIAMGEKPDPVRMTGYITGAMLANPNGFYPITIALLYFVFWLSFKFCKNKNKAIAIIVVFTFVYTLIGTVVPHNPWWFQGEWWYNSVHLFWIGMIFAKNEEKVTGHLKRHYVRYMVIGGILLLVLPVIVTICSGMFSYYYMEGVPALYKKPELFFNMLGRRWVTLLSQMLCSLNFTFMFVMVNLKVKIGNPVLKFMGMLSLEFYLFHGMFVEMFGFDWLEVTKSVYYIRNVALFEVVVLALGIAAALLIKLVMKPVISLVKGKKS